MRACSQANRVQRPGSTLACGRLYLKIIRGRRGQQGRSAGCQMHSLLLFITWHAYQSACPLLGTSIYWEKIYSLMHLCSLDPYKRMFIYVPVLALCTGFTYLVVSHLKRSHHHEASSVIRCHVVRSLSSGV